MFSYLSISPKFRVKDFNYVFFIQNNALPQHGDINTQKKKGLIFSWLLEKIIKIRSSGGNNYVQFSATIKLFIFK